QAPPGRALRMRPVGRCEKHPPGTSSWAHLRDRRETRASGIQQFLGIRENWRPRGPSERTPTANWQDCFGRPSAAGSTSRAAKHREQKDSDSHSDLRTVRWHNAKLAPITFLAAIANSLADTSVGPFGVFVAQKEKQKEKGPAPKNGAFSKIIPAATYVPTQLPVQYHRPGEA